MEATKDIIVNEEVTEEIAENIVETATKNSNKVVKYLVGAGCIGVAAGLVWKFVVKPYRDKKKTEVEIVVDNDENVTEVTDNCDVESAE